MKAILGVLGREIKRLQRQCHESWEVAERRARMYEAAEERIIALNAQIERMALAIGRTQDIIKVVADCFEEHENEIQSIGLKEQTLTGEVARNVRMLKQRAKTEWGNW